jgi:heme oxygenase
MLMRLNMETRAHHGAVDGVWLDLLSPRVTVTQYIALLARGYGFEAPLEGALAYTRQVGSLINLRERARAGMLAQDLLALGFSPVQLTELAQCTDIEPFKSPLEALGWMYVAERTTLLFAQLHRALRRHLPEVSGACAYLACYDGLASARWLGLGRVLDQVTERDDEVEEVLAGAHAGFDCQRRWMRADLSSSQRRRAG